ncbi:MAG: MFS transporter, partial [Pseudomonadota bacterium]
PTTQPPGKRFSFVVSGTAIGTILASFILFLIEKFLTKQEILEFGWRIPYIFGAVLYFIGIILRKNLPYNEIKKDKTSLLLNIFSEYKKVAVFISVMLVPAYLIILNILFPSILPKLYNYLVKDVYLAISLSLIWSVFFTPLFAHLTANFNKINILRLTFFLVLPISILLNLLLNQSSFILLVISLCIYQSIISISMVIGFPLMVKFFSDKLRLTLTSVCYNISFLIASFLPLFISRIIWNNSSIGIWAILVILALFAIPRLNSLENEI